MQLVWQIFWEKKNKTRVSLSSVELAQRVEIILVVEVKIGCKISGMGIHNLLGKFSRRQIDCIFWFFPENGILHFMQIDEKIQILFPGNFDNLHVISNSVSWEKIRKIFQDVVGWKFYLECWALREKIHQCPSSFFHKFSHDNKIFLAPRL